MMAQIPAYYHQLKKAIKRDDRVSVNHRIAEMLAAYFNMLFAVNEIPHPGEKRMLELLESQAKCLPEGMRNDVTQLLQLAPEGSDELLATVERMTQRLHTLLCNEKLLPC